MPRRFEIAVHQGLAAERAAAGIWARATARRDLLPEVAAVKDKLAGIQHALSRDDAALHLAMQGSQACGFALTVMDDRVVELVYLATDPGSWGNGVGQALLDHVQGHAHDARCASMELWVIADNARAIRSYVRAGWSDTGDTAVRNVAGRLENRYAREVSRGDIPSR